MATQLNFQQYALMAWNTFLQPFNISEEYNTWLKVSPAAVNITPLKFYGNQINTTLGIDIFSETFTGNKPAASLPVTAVSTSTSLLLLQINSSYKLRPTFLLLRQAIWPEKHSYIRNLTSGILR